MFNLKNFSIKEAIYSYTTTSDQKVTHRNKLNIFVNIKDSYHYAHDLKNK